MFGLPGIKERVDLLYLYLEKYCSDKEGLLDILKEWWKTPSSIINKKKIIKMEGIDDEIINHMAQETEGFSAREIEKFVINCHDMAFSQINPILTKEICQKALTMALQQHSTRKQWETNKKLN